MKISIGRIRQREIYLNGFSKIKTQIPFGAAEIEQLAKSKLSKNAYGYIATGAGSNQGIQNNLDAFNDYVIIPRMLNGIEDPELSSTILNTKLPYPLLFAPIGVLGLAHPKGDIELAKASKITSVPMIQSCQASFSMERCAEVLLETDRWFQLYFGKSKELVESMVSRAAESGSKAIVLTLDTTMLGWRNTDLQNGFLPFIYGLGIAQYTSDPVFRRLMNESSWGIQNSKSKPGLLNLLTLFKSYPDSLANNIITQNPVKAVCLFSELFSKPELNWDDVKWLRTITKLPVVLKGILHPDDARKALDYGIDGIIVSNHGGRQVDNVCSSLDAFVEINKVLPERYPLLLDSGIRKGVDVFIALAIGAKAVCLGRPYPYALTIAGKDGVIELIQNIVSELQIIMSLTGCKSISDIKGTVIRKQKD